MRKKMVSLTKNKIKDSKSTILSAQIIANRYMHKVLNVQYCFSNKTATYILHFKVIQAAFLSDVYV